MALEENTIVWAIAFLTSAQDGKFISFCQGNYAEMTRMILMKPGAKVEHGPRKNPFMFGADPDTFINFPGNIAWILEYMFATSDCLSSFVCFWGGFFATYFSEIFSVTAFFTYNGLSPQIDCRDQSGSLMTSKV